jgi:septal ring factor EnvC (AmiA/AmiB activator)
MIKWIKWFFSDTKKPIIEEIDVYSKLAELEEKYSALLLDVKRLEEENIETTNTLYEIMNSIDAVDARIDIITAEKFLRDKDV